MSVMMKDAVDIDSTTLRPTRELRDSNFVLDGSARLNQLYEEQGYLLFRGVLDRSSVDKALRRMMAVMMKYGVIAKDATEPLWTGVPAPPSMEESPEFKGICKELVEHPANLPVFEKILGEPACSVPIVQYRSYTPNSPPGPVHQDGFYSPGIHGYRPVWMPLMKIGPDVGSLMLAPGLHKNGLIHNLAKPPVFPIPADKIPADSWATTTFYPGDVLVIHPHTPHFGLANRSDRLRFSIDTRVQSAANPCVLLGDVIATTPRSATLRTQQGDRTIGINERTYIRTGENRGARIPLEDFEKNTPAGLRVVAAIEGDEATVIRRASEG
jgi:hypothetical protein